MGKRGCLILLIIVCLSEAYRPMTMSEAYRPMTMSEAYRPTDSFLLAAAATARNQEHRNMQHRRGLLGCGQPPHFQHGYRTAQHRSHWWQRSAGRHHTGWCTVLGARVYLRLR